MFSPVPREYPPQKKAARRDLLDFKSRLGHLHNYGDREDFHVSMLEGPVAENLLQRARDRKIDLIVVGTDGRGGLGKVILGSVAETLAGTAASTRRTTFFVRRAT